jgi:hypothetical protein
MTVDVPEGTAPFRKVRMSETLFQQLGATSVEWGEPDAEGFYTPTLRLDRRCACGEIPQNRIHHDRTLGAYHRFGEYGPPDDWGPGPLGQAIP